MYAPGGWLLFTRAGALLAQRLDLARGQLTGDPVTVADAVAHGGISLASAFSVSAAGPIAYRSGSSGRRQLLWFDRSGKALESMGAPDTNLSGPRLSPDGRRVAVWRTVQDNQDIWMLDGPRFSRFTFDRRSDRWPIWSPDGSSIVFESDRRKGSFDLYLKASNNAANEQPLLESDISKFATDWSRDGRFLLYYSIDPQTSRDLWVLPMKGDRKPFVFLKTSFNEAYGAFSPDGRWVAYQSDESGRNEVYVRPFAKTSEPSAGSARGEWQVSTSGGAHPRWRSDGKELYYIAPDGKMMAAPIRVRGETLEPGTPVPLFPTRIVGGGSDITTPPQYDVSRDGRFLINTLLDEAAPITLIQNWSPPAK
jgi:Tol biopolymer transport system component